jgi:hypothetical protein
MSAPTCRPMCWLWVLWVILGIFEGEIMTLPFLESAAASAIRMTKTMPFHLRSIPTARDNRRALVNTRENKVSHGSSRERARKIEP